MASSSDRSSCCHLLRLPLELPLHIYDYLVADKHRVRIYIDAKEKSVKEDTGASLANALRLVKTCKQIHQELLPVLHAAPKAEVMFWARAASGTSSKQSKSKPLESIKFLKYVKIFRFDAFADRSGAIAPLVEGMRRVGDAVGRFPSNVDVKDVETYLAVSRRDKGELALVQRALKQLTGVQGADSG